MPSYSLGRCDALVLTSDAASELHVFDHYSHSLGIKGCKVAVFKEPRDEALSCLLESHYDLIPALGDFLDQSLEVEETGLSIMHDRRQGIIETGLPGE